MNIVEFIEARIDEDEQAARAARPGPWIADGWGDGPKIGDSNLMVPVRGGGPSADFIPDEDSEHIARHDPARALRQCKALRATVKILERLSEPVAMPWYVSPKAEEALEEIASIWSEHSDYQQDWSIA